MRSRQIVEVPFFPAGHQSLSTTTRCPSFRLVYTCRLSAVNPASSASFYDKSVVSEHRVAALQRLWEYLHNKIRRSRNMLRIVRFDGIDASHLPSFDLFQHKA